MNQKLLSGLTATLLISTLGAPSSSQAKPSNAVDQGLETTLKVASNQPLTPSLDLTSEVVKIGEQQSQATTSTDGAVIAKIYSYQLAGRKVATLYVRNLPVITFLSSKKASSEGVKLGSQEPNAPADKAPATSAKLLENSNLVASSSEMLPEGTRDSAKSAPSQANQDQANPGDPVWKASEVAAKLNQLNRGGIDAKSITISWNKSGPKGQYVIKANKDVLAIVDSDAMLPETTHDLESDMLQATNRLRRLLGNAPPLNGVAGSPKRRQDISLGPLRIPMSGMASWYGPGFSGNQSASGEIFNQNALTAAHRTLPFGTKVKVTNLHNGMTVVVRINDRGPHTANRIIDLSTAAARVLGLIQSGVAPVRLDVVNSQTEVAGN
jgi:rare lipoprotein A